MYRKVYKPRFKIRKEKAIEQSKITPQTIARDSVISLVEQHLGIKVIKIPDIGEYVYRRNSWCIRLKEFRDYRFANRGTFLWLKFTTTGHLGVVAKSTFRSPDINFSVNNKSGKLVKTAGLEWDRSYVYLFPLGHPDTNKSSKQECEVGDMLIEKKVPIIDYYSHRW